MLGAITRVVLVSVLEVSAHGHLASLFEACVEAENHGKKHVMKCSHALPAARKCGQMGRSRSPQGRVPDPSHGSYLLTLLSPRSNSGG